MINPEIILEVERLLAAGTISMTKIAAQTRISRSSVSSIAHGKRKLKPHRSDPGRPQNLVLDELGNPFLIPSGPVARCSECGAFVRTPCLACQIAKKIKLSERYSKQYEDSSFRGWGRLSGI